MQDKIHDLRHVVCGLVGQLSALAEQARPNETRVMIRKGMEAEIVNAFGSGTSMSVRLIEDLDHDTVILTPAQPKGNPLDII